MGNSSQPAAEPPASLSRFGLPERETPPGSLRAAFSSAA
jgi:hypothetical protein